MKKRLLKFLAVTMVLLMVLSLCSIAFAKSKRGSGNSGKGNSSNSSSGSSNNTTVTTSPLTGNNSTGEKYAEYAKQIVNGGGGASIVGTNYTYDDNGNVNAWICQQNETPKFRNSGIGHCMTPSA